MLVRHLLGPHAFAEDKWADVVCGAGSEEGRHKVVGVEADNAEPEFAKLCQQVCEQVSEKLWGRGRQRGTPVREALSAGIRIRPLYTSSVSPHALVA